MGGKKLVRFLCLTLAFASCAGAVGCKKDPGEGPGTEEETEPKYKETLNEAVLTDGKNNRLSVVFCREDLVHFRYAPDGEEFLPDGAVPGMVEKTDGQYAPVHGEVEESGDGTVIRTAGVTVTVDRKSLGITVSDPDGKVLLRSAAQAFSAGGEGKSVSFVRDEACEEHFYGLGNDPGDTFTTTDHRDTEYALWMSDNNVHAIIPLWYSTAGYGIYLNNSYRGKVSFGKDYGVSVDGGEMNFYFLYGPEFFRILSNWSELAGRMAMPPLYALGLTYRGYGSWNEDQLCGAIMAQYDEGIAVDIAGVEPGWQTATYPCTYAWSEKFTSDPAAFVERMHAAGLHVNLWEHPYVSPQAEIYGDMLACSLKSEDLGTREWEGNSGKYAFGGLVPDMTLSEAGDLYWELHDKNLISIGVDGFKVDETDSWGASASLTTVFPGGLPANAYHNLLGTLTVNLLHEKYKEDYDKRSFLFSRGNYAGMQRYATSAYTDYYGYDQFVMSVIAQGYSGTYYTPEIRDVSTPDDVAYMRRAQLMFLTPFSMSNEWATEATVLDRSRTVIDCYRKYNELHYSLIPYMYSLFWEQHNTGIGVTRPLAMEFPDDPKAVKIDDEFLLGPSLLVCPVSDMSRVATEDVYLPAGEIWMDYNTGYLYEGGQTLKYTSSASVLPLFVRMGAILPLGHYGNNTSEVTDRTLTLDLYPAEKETSFTLYEDDGISYGYEKGKYALTPVTMKKDAGKITVTLGERTGAYPVADRPAELRVHYRAAPDGVTLDGKKLERMTDRAAYDAASGACWFYDAAAENDFGLIVYVKCADDGKGHEVCLTVGKESTLRTPTLIMDGTIYEFEAEANVLEGASVNRGKKTASGGAIVGAVGDDGKRAVTVKKITVNEDGYYDTEIVFFNGSGAARRLQVSVNGGEMIPLVCPSNGNWDLSQSLTVPLFLKKGENEIRFTTKPGEGYAPDLDCLFLYDKAPVQNGMKGDVLTPDDAKLEGSLKITEMGGAAGGKAVTGIGLSAENRMIYTVTVPKAGPYQLNLNYSNPSDAGKKINLEINGQITELNLPGTKSTHIFAVLNQTVYLDAGENVISLWYNGSVSLYECEIGGDYVNCNNRLETRDGYPQSGGYSVGAGASDGKSSFTMKGIRVPGAGTYRVLVYAASADVRTFRLKVNGEDTGEKYNVRTGHYHDFKPHEFELELKAGDNTLTFWQEPKAKGDSEWLPNFDYIVLPDVVPDYEILLGAISVR